MALDRLAEQAARYPFAGELAKICARHNGLWNLEAETFLLQHAPAYSGA